MKKLSLIVCVICIMFTGCAYSTKLREQQEAINNTAIKTDTNTANIAKITQQLFDLQTQQKYTPTEADLHQYRILKAAEDKSIKSPPSIDVGDSVKIATRGVRIFYGVVVDRRAHIFDVRYFNNEYNTYRISTFFEHELILNKHVKKAYDPTLAKQRTFNYYGQYYGLYYYSTLDLKSAQNSDNKNSKEVSIWSKVFGEKSIFDAPEQVNKPK